MAGLMEELRAARRAQGLRQSDLAALLGVQQNQVSRVERSADPKLSTVEAYAAALGLRLALVSDANPWDAST